MSYRFTRQRIRIECDITKMDAAIKEKITGSTPKFARAAAVQFEVALFFGGELVDISNISAATLTILDSTRTTTQMTQTIGPTAMNPGLTAALWAAGGQNDQHFKFTFESDATGIGSSTTSTHWLALHGLTTDDTLDVDVFGCGEIQTYDAGISDVTSPEPAAEGGVTLSQVQALMQGFAKKVMDPGETLTFQNKVGGKRIVGIDDLNNPIDLFEI